MKLNIHCMFLLIKSIRKCIDCIKEQNYEMNEYKKQDLITNLLNNEIIEKIMKSLEHYEDDEEDTNEIDEKK